MYCILRFDFKGHLGGRMLSTGPLAQVTPSWLSTRFSVGFLFPHSNTISLILSGQPQTVVRCLLTFCVIFPVSLGGSVYCLAK